MLRARRHRVKPSLGGASVPRSRRWGKSRARRFKPAGFSFGFGGCGNLLLLLRLALRRRWRNRPSKSGGPPLFALSLKVQRNIAHNRLRVRPAPVLRPQRSPSPKGPTCRHAESASGAHSLAPIGRQLLARGPNPHQRARQTQQRAVPTEAAFSCVTKVEQRPQREEEPHNRNSDPPAILSCHESPPPELASNGDGPKNNTA